MSRQPSEQAAEVQAWVQAGVNIGVALRRAGSTDEGIEENRTRADVAAQQAQ